MSVSSTGQIPYRRLTDPLSLPYGTTSQRTAVPANFIPPEATSFRVTNRGNFWVRLKGTRNGGASNLTIADGEGWLFPPGFSGTFTTQFPEAMATISVGPSAGTGVLEVSYGIGSSGESVAALIAAGGQTNGSVTVTNFPAVQPVSDNGGSLTVDGAVSVTNLPATQPVSGSVSVSNFPATQPISIATNPLPTGAGSVNAGQVAIGQATAVQIVPARATRRKVTIAPTSQFTYFVGNTGVTASTGFAVLNGGALTLETTAAVFAIGNSTGTMTFVEVF